MGVIANKAFRKAMLDGRISDEEIKDLLSPTSAQAFRINCNIPFLIANKPAPKNGRTRYYAEPIEYNGHQYYITSDLLSRTKSILVQFLAEHGLTQEDIIDACSVTQESLSTEDNKQPNNKLPKGKVVFPYKVGQVMQYAFRVALEKGYIPQKDIQYLMSMDASKRFKAGGYQVVIPASQSLKDSRGKNRYYTSTVLCYGKEYRLTKEVWDRCLQPILEYLEEHGMTRKTIAELCQKGIESKHNKTK